jgi:hypothetical protein
MKHAQGRRVPARPALKQSALFWLPLVVLVFGPGMMGIDASQAKGAKICTKTAKSAFTACKSEIKDDYFIAVGTCNNLSDAELKASCLEAAKTDYQEAKQTCADQRQARLDLCEGLGQAAYDPQLDPARFVDPANIGGSVAANSYFPLVPNTTQVYQTTNAGTVLERITVTVTDDTKVIEYPAGSGKMFTCAVVTDEVEEYVPGDDSYRVKESTIDWYAQDFDGNVWYFGEISQSFENGELIDTAGSWKAGRDGAKPGIIMYYYPDTSAEPPQMVYRQEFLLGDAEDIGEFVGFVDSLTVRGVTYTNVLQTRDYTPIESEVFEYKYYAPGVGVVLEEGFEDDSATGEMVELVP